ncbi:MAG: MarR family transcriptional regulator [Candidatus Omnitrophica bacterium]|nr:MarR family transcriptional regulator [Candidatus Omnitrophota bacterium]
MKQQSIDEYVEQVVRVLPQVIRWFHVNRANALTRAQLNPAQFYVLDIISELGEQKMSQLSRKLSVSLPAVTRIVDKLFAEKMVERIPGEKDRRVIEIKITLKGKKIVAEFRKQRQQAFKDIFSKLCEKDRQDYLRILRTLNEVTLQTEG